MGELTRLMDSIENNTSGAYTGGVNNQTFQNLMQRLNDTTSLLNRTPASPHHFNPTFGN